MLHPILSKYLDLLRNFNLLVKIALFGIFAAKFFDPVCSHALKIFLLIKQSKLPKRSIQFFLFLIPLVNESLATEGTAKEYHLPVLSMYKDQFLIETARAFLLPVSKKNGRLLHARIYSDPQVMATFGAGERYPFYKTIKRVYQHERRWKESYPYSGWIAVEKRTHKLVGYIVCGNGPTAHCSELIFLIPHNRWGQGWGKEISAALVECFIPYILNQKIAVKSGENFVPHTLKALEATARTDNIASCKILEYLGFTCSEEIEKWGRRRRHYYLSLED